MGKKLNRIVVLIVLMVIIAVVAVACATRPVSPENCGFIVGTEASGDMSIKSIAWPGQNPNLTADEMIRFVPCNPRNYLITDGGSKDGNGNVIGDRTTLTTVTLKTGTKLQIGSSAYFTLNQDKETLEKFYAFCRKYKCYQDSNEAGDVNAATPGWNEMLGQNFGPAVDRALEKAVFSDDINDDIWIKNDPNQKEKVADTTSSYFAKELRSTVGFEKDIFCGSGNSQWSNPNEPGVGTFNCSPVRFKIDSVRVLASEQTSQGSKALGEQRQAIADAQYGSGNGGFWLGLQDTIKMCQEKGVSCVFNIGGESMPKLNMPTVSPTTNP